MLVFCSLSPKLQPAKAIRGVFSPLNDSAPRYKMDHTLSVLHIRGKMPLPTSSKSCTSQRSRKSSLPHDSYDKHCYLRELSNSQLHIFVSFQQPVKRERCGKADISRFVDVCKATTYIDGWRVPFASSLKRDPIKSNALILGKQKSLWEEEPKQ
jgi:hypothetical protein